MMKWKVFSILFALVLVLSLVMATPVMAKAEKLELRDNPPWCDAPGLGESVAGFVVLNNDNEADTVVVVVSLKNGAPNRIYGVYLEDYKVAAGGRPNWKAWAYLGSLTTNGKGKGNFDARVPRSAGTYFLQVVVSYPSGSWGPKSFGTDIATVTIK